MSEAEILAEAIRLDDPSVANEDGMACQVWNDGEITLQKSGSLLWQRTLHQMQPGEDGRNLEGLPHEFNGSRFVWVRDLEAAKRLSSMIRSAST